MLARVVVEETPQPKGNRKGAVTTVRARGRGHSGQEKSPPRADDAAQFSTSSAPEFMSLPVGWRMEVLYERVAGSKGVAVETVFVSPNRARFKSLAEAKQWLSSPANRLRLPAGLPHTWDRVGRSQDRR
jgi:hypothetical protein